MRLEVKAGIRGKPVPGASSILGADKCSGGRQLGLPCRDPSLCPSREWPLRCLFLSAQQVRSADHILLSARRSVTHKHHEARSKVNLCVSPSDSDKSRSQPPAFLLSLMASQLKQFSIPPWSRAAGRASENVASSKFQGAE